MQQNRIDYSRSTYCGGESKVIIIEGFEPAKLALSRRTLADYNVVSTAVRERLAEIFGIEINPEQAVCQIVNDVCHRGDAALLDYTLKIDRIQLTSIEVSRAQISAAYEDVDGKLVSALKMAADRIRLFHNKQKDSIGGKVSHLGLGQLIRPIQRVGVYAPGGTACYPSTVLMTAIPARVAGVKEIILTTPPGLSGAVPSPTLVAADIAGVDRVFGVGGAQAVAALAYGTDSIPRVDKICGPGNIFVVLAKKLVFGVVDIDGLPGPSEVVVIADAKANPVYSAADLLAQAEHDPLASAILITTSSQLAIEVNREIKQQIKSLPRQAVAFESLENKGFIVVVDNMDQAIKLANIYAPEHLSLVVDKATSYIDKVSNAGCIFIGGNSSIALGDYIAGPSHVLPTGGTARFGSPLSIIDFIKLTSLINIDTITIKQLGPAAAIIARAEGFEAHARAIEKRLMRD
ncbi:histidinol dehydrogenase [Chloroflexota bacterium]